ncbi:MAG: hypothetical protein NUV98_07200, partial [Candidatus Roizmanbacteria bacterium]|nr:hypothetical protein [Candidatus Roizmanbacteria bacterium]
MKTNKSYLVNNYLYLCLGLGLLPFILIRFVLFDDFSLISSVYFILAVAISMTTYKVIIDSAQKRPILKSSLLVSLFYINVYFSVVTHGDWNLLPVFIGLPGVLLWQAILIIVKGPSVLT